MTRRAAALAVTGALALAATGVAWAAVSASVTTTESYVRDVARTLKCPTCVGESVADSAAPVANAMRAVIADQVEQGQSPDQIRSWFAERYGTEVLLDPSPFSGGWLLWIVPLVIIAAAVVLAVRRRRSSARWLRVGVTVLAVSSVLAVWGLTAATDAGVPTLRDNPDAELDPVIALTVLADAVEESPGDADLQLALARALDEAERLSEAERHYAAASRLRPLDADIAYLHATALVREGRLAEATVTLDRVLTMRSEHSPALLLLGTILWKAGDERGVQLLEEFVAREPDHAASADVRALLSEGSP